VEIALWNPFQGKNSVKLLSNKDGF
jgi:hypothetical protein